MPVKNSPYAAGLIQQQNQANAFNALLSQIVSGQVGANVFDPSFFAQAGGLGALVNGDLLNKAQTTNNAIGKACSGGTCNQEQANATFNQLFPQNQTIPEIMTTPPNSDIAHMTATPAVSTPSTNTNYGPYLLIGLGALILLGLSR